MKSFTAAIIALVACVIIFSPTGLTATLPAPLNQIPVADAGPDLEAYVDHGVTLQGSGWDPDTDPIQGFLWNVESSPSGSDTYISNEYAPNPLFWADMVGDYVLSLIVYDGTDWSLPDTMTVTVIENLPPVAVATADTTIGTSPFTVHFDGSESYDPEEADLVYDWDFGDGFSSEEVSPSHEFLIPNTYTVRLKVWDELYQFDEDTVTIHVYGYPLIVPDYYSTIQHAINVVYSGDEKAIIIVRPGIYFENINFLGKACTLKSELGPAATTINGGQAGNVVSFTSGEGPNSVLDGFTITNGKNDPGNGGGIYCENSAPTIINNIIRHNSAENGGGIYCEGLSPRIVNNIIFGNTAVYGAGIYCDAGSSPIIVNNTLYGNSASTIGGGIICWEDASPTVVNTILWANYPDEIALHGTSTATVTYCDVHGGYPGTGNIDEEPIFVFIPGRGPLHLSPSSPCIDAGFNFAPYLPDTDFEGDPRFASEHPWGLTQNRYPPLSGTSLSRIDMGADEYAFPESQQQPHGEINQTPVKGK